MSQTSFIRRTGRRETHSSRAALSVVSAAVMLAAVLWLVLELVLSLTGNTALLISPTELLSRLASLGTATIPAALIAAGVVLALIGAAYVLAAILPGTKPRHIIENQRAAVVVERDVLASAVARTARTAAQLAPEQVTASVGHRDVQVRVHPTSGKAVDQLAVQEAVDREVSGYALARALKVTVVVARQGAVGV
ncbi:hypothetical protein AL755_02100 (plasmid) [Arthrobacter sp. ERGS1:01]|uniref:hypothetical protein n=1 Tax=Arthrobacter sp. ERGS1:01 TaxID=1704044 RepID=UPI0006B5FBAC|nr:hypothetical protein [Arthrobacter sp. ERGS1:01]ALE04491.1 hypothetical protein AL755_02100 [Arthrobacter sp. ERGS1:01]